MTKRLSLGWLAMVVLGAVAFAPAAHAKGLVIADVYGEPDVRAEAGAVTLLVNTALAEGPQPAVERARLQAALEKAGVPIRGGLSVPPGKTGVILKALGADYLVSGVMARRGTRLLVTLRISDAAAKTLGVYQLTAPSGEVGLLARELAGRVARVTKATPGAVPDSGLADLRPYASAAEALADKDSKEALDALSAGSSATAKNVRAARAIAESMLADKTTPDGARAGLLALLDPSAVGQTDAQVAELKGQNPELAALVTAKKAHAAGDAAAREAALVPLLVAGDPRTLRWVAELPSNTLGAAAEKDVLAAAERLANSRPGLASILALRSARGGAPNDVTLPLLRPVELSVGEVAELQPILAKAVAARNLTAVRLQAEIAMRGGDIATARGLLSQVIAAKPDDAIAQRLMGRVLSEQGDLPGAIAAFRAAAADGNQLAQRELARALIKGGEAEAGLDILRQLASDARSVESRVAAARSLTAKGMGTLAIGQLEEAYFMAPDDVAVLKNLSEAYEASGNTAKATEVLDLLSAYEKAEDVSLAAALDLPDAGDATEVANLQQDPEEAKAKQVALSEGGDVGQVAERLELELSRFPALAGHRRVLVVPKAGSGGGMFYSVAVETYEKAVVQALSKPPFDARVVKGTNVRLGDRPDKKQLADMLFSAKAEVVLAWRVNDDGGAMRVMWFVYDGKADQAFESSGSIAGGGIVKLRIVWPLLAGVLVLAIIGLIVRSILIGYGTIIIKLKSDPAATDLLYSTTVNRMSVAPEIKDPDAYVRKLKASGPKTYQSSATHVGAVTKLERIRPGAYFAHVYGTHVKGEGVRIINPKSTNFRVSKNMTATVEFDLVPAGAEYRIGIYDGPTPLPGAVISIDSPGKNDSFTGPDGSIIIEIPRGRHVLIIQARGMRIERPVEVNDTKSKSMSVNLERERALAGRNMALEGYEGSGNAAPHPDEVQHREGGMSIGAAPSSFQVHAMAQGASMYAEPKSVGYMATAYARPAHSCETRSIASPRPSFCFDSRMLSSVRPSTNSITM